jgi:uncharacterized integral membrane protein
MSVFRVVTSALLFVFVLAMIAFAVLNPEDHVDIQLGFGAFTNVPLVLALGIAFGVGVVFTLIFVVAHLLGLYGTIRSLKRTNRALERELTDLRNLPLEEEEESEAMDLSPRAPRVGR